LGTEVLPESDALNAIYSDTATIETHTIKYADDVRSYADQFKFLGSNQDPLFGRTDAGIFTRFSLPNNISNVSFGDDVVLDSCVMVLTFTQKFTGDTTMPLHYKVFQLNSALDKATSYYMNSTVAFNPVPIGDQVQKINFSSGFYNIRIRLNAAWAESIISNPQYLVNNTTFTDTYKGLYVTTSSTNLNPSSAQGSLMKIDLDNSISGVYVYYHNGPQSAAKEPKIYQFLFKGDFASRFNGIDHNLSGAGANGFVDQLGGDTLKGQQTIFLKGLAGSKVTIRFPHIRNFAAPSPISVSRAEITFKVDPSFVTTGGQYDPPLQLSLVAIDSLGREAYVKDQLSTTEVIRFGGDYDADNKQYVFNIARHLQDIMQGKIGNYGFYLVVANPEKTQVARRDEVAARVVLGGSKNALYKPQFRLTYVSFPFDK